MINFNALYAQLATSPLAPWLVTLPAQLQQWQHHCGKDFMRWERALSRLPHIPLGGYDLASAVRLWPQTPLPLGQQQALTSLLKQWMPWRKGPFHIHGVDIDTEWRSDWKWERLKPHISPLANRYVLDVGCGSGYHLWRMVGADAKLAIGIDPTALFLCQFDVVRHFLNQDQRAHLVPLGIQDMPPLQAFDTVFSMGVLYHRKSPFEHLEQLKNQLRSGGELVLETLVIEGDAECILTPKDRYAQMNNVWFIPSCAALVQWLERVGFTDVRVLDNALTSTAEQRRTDWMQNESLADFLDATDPTKTIEGYPAPRRALLIAQKP